MKNFVKVLAILLAVFMALAVFAACDKKNNDKPDDKPVDDTPVDDKPADDTPKHEHAWVAGSVTKEATCTEEGEQIFTCSGCNETKTEKIAALGHTWDEGKVTKEATVDEEGEKTFTCTVCGETKVEKIDKVPVDPSAEKPGDYVTVGKARYLVNKDLTYTYLYSTEDKGKTTEIEIKATANGKKVVRIEDTAFEDWSKLSKVTIEEGILTIGEDAFKGCTSLIEIDIPDSVTEIGKNAFKDCTALQVVTLGDSLSTIPANAFDGCAMITILDLGNGLTALDPDTFAASDANLVKVTIGESLVTLQNSAKTKTAFNNAVKNGKLKVVVNNADDSADDFFGTNGAEVKAAAKAVKDAEGKNYIAYDKETGFVFYVEGFKYALVAHIGVGQQDPDDEDATINPAKKVLVLPASFGEDKEPYAIAPYAFAGRTDIAKVVIPEGVTGIGESAFANCSELTSATVKATAVSDGMFLGCGKLETVTLAASVTSIGSAAFANCTSLTAVTIPESVGSIGDGAFLRCTNLATLTFAGTPTITTIGYMAFAETAIVEFNLPKTVTTLVASGSSNGSSRLLEGCNALTTITVADGNTVFSAAGNCLIKTADKKVIAGCKASVIPTDSSVVTTIGARAFEGLSSMTAITIPKNVTEIEALAFTQCTSLTTINYTGTKAEWDDVTKGANWNFNTGAYTIHCTDGDIAK